MAARISVLWRDQSLHLLDQRKLPLSYEYVVCSDHHQVAEAIKTMVVRGALAIGAAGAYGLALSGLNSEATKQTDFLCELENAKCVLDSSRPTAVNLSWATGRVLYVCKRLLEHDGALASIRKLLLEEAHEIAEDDVRVNLRLSINGAALIKHGGNILHHCNTGRLASIAYGTALGVVYRCHEEKKNIHVWVNETRPRLQGARLTAWELMQAQVPMTLIADNSTGHLMYQGKIDVILFGADRVAANGDVANKVGTFNICLMGHVNDIPRYACVPISTIDLSVDSGKDIPIEERDEKEVTHVDGAQVAPLGVKVYNPAFDVTPAKFITGIITEVGVCYPPYEQSLREAVEQEQAKAAKDRDKRLEQHVEALRTALQKRQKVAD